MSEMTSLYEQYRPKLAISSLQKGLVLHQPLDIQSLKSATLFGDKTPYNNDGTSANTPAFTTDRMGQSNRAMSFNGVSDYVDLGRTDYNFGTDDFSISLWTVSIKDTSFRTFMSKGRAVATDCLLYKRDNNFIRFYGNGGTINLEIPSVTWTENEWFNLVVKREGTVAKMYLNGELKATDTSAGADLTNTHKWIIGAEEDGGQNFIKGNISDVRIYNRAISEQEITMLYEQYRPNLRIG